MLAVSVPASRDTLNTSIWVVLSMYCSTAAPTCSSLSASSLSSLEVLTSAKLRSHTGGAIQMCLLPTTWAKKLEFKKYQCTSPNIYVKTWLGAYNRPS